MPTVPLQDSRLTLKKKLLVIKAVRCGHHTVNRIIKISGPQRRSGLWASRFQDTFEECLCVCILLYVVQLGLEIEGGIRCSLLGLLPALRFSDSSLWKPSEKLMSLVAPHRRSLTFSEGAFPYFSPGKLSHRWPSCWSSWGLSAPAGLGSSAMQIPVMSLSLCRPHLLLWNLQCPHACLVKEICLGNVDNCLFVC